MERLFLVSSGLFGFLAVVLGAFGAHGLKTRLADLPDAAQRMDWWTKAAHYQLTHALALGLAAYLVGRTASTASQVAGVAFIIGMLIFSGSLYVMTLTGIRVLGAVTPLGGLSFLVGWVAVIVASWGISGDIARPLSRRISAA